MTRSGRLMSVDRYGINKNDIGPLAKASFEETEKILLNAALFSEVDPVTGVSANIMTGQTIRGGTAFSQIMLDQDAMMRLQENLPIDEGDEEEDDEFDEEALERRVVSETEQNETCNDTVLRVNQVMPRTSELPVDYQELDMEINEI
jgi:DNA-directed RNA polymerase beta' subunit